MREEAMVDVQPHRWSDKEEQIILDNVFWMSSVSTCVRCKDVWYDGNALDVFSCASESDKSHVLGR